MMRRWTWSWPSRSITMIKKLQWLPSARVLPVWESAIAEADFDNRKARIDARVAGLIYLNLIYANIWLEEYDRVDVLFDEMRRLDTKKSAEGTAEGLDTFSEDQRKRKEVNS